MTVTYSGSLTIGGCIPAADAAASALVASVGVAMPDIQSRVDGLLSATLQPPPSLASMVASAQATAQALQTLIAAPLPDVAATGAALADLQATLGVLSASLTLANGLSSLLGIAGVAYFVAAGRAGDIGSELSAHLSAGLPGSGSGPDQQIAGVMLLASDGAAAAAIAQVFR